MYNKKENKLLTGTIEETKMKLSAEGNYPIFEIHHSDIMFMINIVCFPYAAKNKTSFALDPPLSDPKKYVNSNNINYLY